MPIDKMYSPPKSNFTKIKEQKRIGWLAIVISITLTILNLLLFASLGISKSASAAELTGYVSAPIVVGLLVVLIFQIGKRFRNTHSRLKIYCWTLFVSLFSSCSQITETVAQNTELMKVIIELEKEREEEIANLKPLEEVMAKAKAGDILAQAELGRRYLNGLGAEEDRQKAFEWYLRAARQGHARAQYRVGDIYRYYVVDLPLEERKKEMMAWYLKAAIGCDSYAQHELGYLHEPRAVSHLEEVMVKPDINESKRWHERAALNGHGGSMARLGLLLAEGQGADKDEIEGLAWHYVSNKLHGVKGAHEMEFKAIEGRMTTEQISRAKGRALHLLFEVKNHQCSPKTQK